MRRREIRFIIRVRNDIVYVGFVVDFKIIIIGVDGQ